jgi:hypothetical protein
MRFKRNGLIVALIFTFWIIDLLSKLKYNGLVYGFDYGLFHPDGSLYTFRTLTFLGHSQQSAGAQVSNWYAMHAYKLSHFDGSSLYFNINPQWDRFLPRVLYPLFSAPFVAVLGISGMLVVPALSMLATMLVICFLANRYFNPALGIFVAFLFSISPTINRWMFIDTTDSLLVGLTSIVVLLLTWRRHNRYTDFGIVLLVILTSLTRVAILEWIGISLVMYCTKRRKMAALITATAVIFFIPSILNNTSTAILPNSGRHSIFSKIMDFPLSFIRVGFYELAELAVLDRLLLALLLFAIYCSIRFIRKASSKYFLAVLVSLWLTGAVNGTVGVNFRYQLPILAFLGWVLLDSGSETFRNFSRFIESFGHRPKSTKEILE